MRLFIAFDIPDAIKEVVWELEKGLSKLTDRVRFTPKENMHLTVKFMGEQPDFALIKIKELLSSEVNKHACFKIRFDKAGVFKDIQHPNVLWLGEENPEFERIAATLNKELEIFRRPDNKPFCHLTIGRVKYIKADDLLEAIKFCRDFLKNNELSFMVDTLYLYESKLFKSGAVYRKIEKFHLKGV
ncbi:RNA 2',3'-cyclic phosphodiesterase [Hippea maritima]|uniref:RNA 2',3'-cyclic phosphodiesterase n=1 Tax=Hippea maritima (strain ATCC 700847 / DSM 10411 / MH2) TaxID=760142 RepID=F2LXN8_HIPMA|nr:RNA 2',3'-cyclic phosphodiesterase [Hippea maritima]AEA33224.1 2'-5' RNA ligase [Hippea maritima DSM 10411]